MIPYSKYDTPERYNSRRQKLIPLCRFYKGEDVCPYESMSKEEYFWKYEAIWVDKMSHSYTEANLWRDDLARHKKIEAYVKEMGLPSSLIGLLINREEHWIGMVDDDDFINGLRIFYLKDSK